MIHWLLQTQTAHPDLGQGVSPPGLLSEEETAVFNKLRILKRRQDWLLGRWTAKHLIQEMMHQKHGESVPLNAISILAAEDGAPLAKLNSQFDHHGSRFTVSISHSQGSSFCAVIERPNWPLGADIERIEPRARNFTADFFTEAEQAFIEQSRPEMVDALVTTIWSGKEAALKAIRQGLRVDTRDIYCQVKADDTLPQEWTALHLNWQRQEDKQQLPSLSGWWKVDGQYVLTLAAQDNH
ncbi:MAG: 4'-phosphopantetheinyl transferase superfamily protein [Anaerolineaceae bacterium]|nr:MAG: 4'-phosphopantetheinyl transferase superfamily protein [Anaerolineaceae bacterium]